MRSLLAIAFTRVKNDTTTLHSCTSQRMELGSLPLLKLRNTASFKGSSLGHTWYFYTSHVLLGPDCTLTLVIREQPLSTHRVSDTNHQATTKQQARVTGNSLACPAPGTVALVISTVQSTPAAGLLFVSNKEARELGWQSQVSSQVQGAKASPRLCNVLVSIVPSHKMPRRSTSMKCTPTRGYMQLSWMSWRGNRLSVGCTPPPSTINLHCTHHGHSQNAAQATAAPNCVCCSSHTSVLSTLVVGKVVCTQLNCRLPRCRSHTIRLSSLLLNVAFQMEKNQSTHICSPYPYSEIQATMASDTEFLDVESPPSEFLIHVQNNCSTIGHAPRKLSSSRAGM
jgi:hypothetical protein